MKKLLAFLLVVAIAVGGYFMFFKKTDEEKIEARFEQFEQSYKDGDLEGCIACFDNTSQNAYKGAETLGSMIGGSVGLFNFNLGSDTLDAIFGLGVAGSGCELNFDIKSIDFDGDDEATVVADVYMKDNSFTSEIPEENTFTVVREKNEWYEFWKNDWYLAEDF